MLAACVDPATPLCPIFGQIAPKMELSEALRWSCATQGRVPRLAQHRVILFFWPMRFVSRTRFLSRPDRRAFILRRPPRRRDVFKILDRARLGTALMAPGQGRVYDQPMARGWLSVAARRPDSELSYSRGRSMIRQRDAAMDHAGVGHSR